MPTETQEISRGLSGEDAARLLIEHGPNEIPEAGTNVWRLVLRQLNDVLVFILLAALALSIGIAFVEEGGAERFLDAIVIGAIIVLNFVFGFVQEFAAERSIEALRRMSAADAVVRRDGRVVHVPARDLVPGDVVLLESGARVPADGELIECSHLRVDESALTGESLEVRKEIASVPEDAPHSEQVGRLYSGSLLTRGTAELRVERTGLDSEMGKIAGAVSSAETPPTPLQRRLARLARILGVAVVTVTAVVVGVGLLQSLPLVDVLLIGVSLAVSAVPEGLAAVVTVCFALGVRQMARRNALVRRLDALETLGEVTVICTDKTGTLTENRMTVVRVWLPADADERALADVAASCNRAELPDAGEPTELALRVWARDHGGERLPIDAEEIPFTSESKCMQTLHGGRSFLKGAPEVVAERCGQAAAEELLERATHFAGEGLRVLAAAVLEGGEVRVAGLWGMSDPPRQGVAEAIASARGAGVRTVMITGDAPSTAAAIARQIGLPDSPIITGAELSQLRPEERTARIAETPVFARVEPLHKLEILKSLAGEGEVVAMTGDGVNDAPAIRGAHVGIAMGARGTDVARGAASIVLADDHFATIVAAIAEGRRIHDNIRRFVLYLLRSNFDELLLILTAFVVGLPLPLLPIHILWVNLMTDGLPALALATEAAEPDVMTRPPRPRDSDLLDGEWGRLAFAAFVAFGLLLGYFWFYWSQGAELDHVRTGTLTLATAFELLLAFSSRSSAPIWRSRPWSNRWLLGACAAVLGAHLLLLYSPLRVAFHLVPLTLGEWAVIIPLAVIGIIPIELFKARRPGAQRR